MNNTARNIDTLHDVLIGEIASYLNQRDYHRFSLSNSRILSCCNSPKTLQSIVLIRYVPIVQLIHIFISKKCDYSLIQLKDYPFLKYLSINMNKFAELKLPTESSILHQLEHINFALDNNSDIEPFVQQNCIDLSKVKTLSLSQAAPYEFSADKLWVLLKKFPNIEDLQIKFLKVTDEMIHDDDIKGLMPNLKQLTLTRSSLVLTYKLMEIFANDLEAINLTIDYDDMDEFKIDQDIEFPRLEVLVISGSKEHVEQITNISPNVRIVSFATFNPKTLENILNNHQHLECINISGALWLHIEEVIDDLEIDEEIEYIVEQKAHGVSIMITDRY